MVSIWSCNSLAEGVEFIEPPLNVIQIAIENEYGDFPKKEDILAIARIESGFNSNARNKISVGIMQVNNGPKDLQMNMLFGIRMLRNLYIKLGSEKAAVIAYNIGIGNYLKDKLLVSGNNYYLKFRKHRSLYNEYFKKN